MLRFLLSLKILFVFSTLSFSQEITESHIKAARRAIQSIRATDAYDSVLSKAALSLKYELIQQWPDKHVLISEIVNRHALVFAHRRADLEQEVATIYAHAFSEQDLKNISHFYNSESGKKLLKQGPVILQDIGDAANIWHNGIVRDLADSVQRDVSNLQNSSMK